MVIKPDQYEMDSELKNLIHTVNIPKNIQDLLKWFIDANKSTKDRIVYLGGFVHQLTYQEYSIILKALICHAFVTNEKYELLLHDLEIPISRKFFSACKNSITRLIGN